MWVAGVNNQEDKKIPAGPAPGAASVEVVAELVAAAAGSGAEGGAADGGGEKVKAAVARVLSFKDVQCSQIVEGVKQIRESVRGVPLAQMVSEVAGKLVNAVRSMVNNLGAARETLVRHIVNILQHTRK